MDDLSGSSPHTRGTPGGVMETWTRIRIIPAYAGYTAGLREGNLVPQDHPRIRGVHLDCLIFPVGLLGSSPHTRGTRRIWGWKGWCGRIIPAYAGYTSEIVQVFSQDEDHPRIRGVHPTNNTLSCPPSGSSPHTRGTHLKNAQNTPFLWRYDPISFNFKNTCCVKIRFVKSLCFSSSNSKYFVLYVSTNSR